MPGWQQIGAVWLPLPHVLNMLPVQVDSWYRSGASAVAISVASMAIGTAAFASFVVRRTGSASAAVAGAVLMMGNPNVLYLQSTPMTEPLLFGTVLLAVAVTADWVDRGVRSPVHVPGLAIAAACMTRYEAWPICAALIALMATVLVRRGTGFLTTVRAVARLSAYPAAAIVVFLLNSRWTVGSWFISSGFFVPENEALGMPMIAVDQVREGVYRLSSIWSVWPAYVAALVLIAGFALSRRRASLVLVLALAAAAILPWYAYVEGHPFRIRYSIPLVIACAAITATAIGTFPRLVRDVIAIGIVITTLWHVPPLDRTAPLIAESQRDAHNSAERKAVTDYLRAHHNGRTIMMSMGSLAHYMHDLSSIGLEVHDFLHEGNGEVWKAAVEFGPRAYVTWIAIEETAEGGDVLSQRAKSYPRFLDGFSRVAEGGGVALYRATPE